MFSKLWKSTAILKEGIISQKRCSFFDCMGTSRQCLGVHTPDNRSIIIIMHFVICPYNLSVQNKSGPVGPKPVLTSTKRWSSSLSCRSVRIVLSCFGDLNPSFWGVIKYLSSANHQSAAARVCLLQSEQTVWLLEQDPHTWIWIIVAWIMKRSKICYYSHHLLDYTVCQTYSFVTPS